MPDQDVLGRSHRLSSPKFAGLVEQHIGGGERVLLADDCSAEIFELSGTFKHHHDLAAVLTDRRLLLFRGRGMMGVKKPWTIELRQVEQTAVTRQGNASVKYKGENGFPGMWKLVLRDEPLADLWMNAIGQACHSLSAGDTARREDELASRQAELARQRGETPPTSADSSDNGQLGRLHGLLDALQPFATPDTLRRPFGQGSGLDEAMQLVFQHLQSPEEARACGEMMMVEMLTAARDDRVVDDALEIMGATADAALRHQTGPAPKDIGDAAIALLQQHRGPGSMWDLWLRRDDVVVEMLCWHSIARLRMATAGLMAPISRPTAA